MLRVFTDNSDLALTLDNFAFFANWFNRRSYFHDVLLSVLPTVFGQNKATRPKKTEYHFITTFSRMQYLKNISFDDLFVSPDDAAFGKVVG